MREYSAGLATTKMDVRLALRAARVERKRTGLTLDKLSAESGVDRAAIHRIESVEKYPNYEPGIETVAKIVEAMGLTLSDFFAQIEGLRPTEGSDQQSATPTTKADPNARTLSAAEHSADAYVRMEFVEALAEQFVAAFDRLATARAEVRSTKTAKPARRHRSDSSR